MDQRTSSVGSAVVLVCKDNNRGLDVGGKAYSQLLDPIGASLKERGIAVHSVPDSRRSKFIGPAAENCPRPFRPEEAAAFVIAGRLRRAGLRRAAMSLAVAAWSHVLRQLDTGLIVAIQPSEALCRAGHLCGVKIIDFQHGQINLRSAYYRRCKEYLDRGQWTLVPSEVRCWDEISAVGVTSLIGLPSGVAGHPGLAIRHHPPVLAPVQWRRPTSVSRMPTGHGRELPVVLVVDSWTSGIEDEMRRKSFLAAVAETSQLVPKMQFIVRAHPVQFRTCWDLTLSEYAEIFGEQFDLRSCAEAVQTPLFDLLSQARLMVTRGSGAIIEASYLGVPVGVVQTDRRELRELFQDEYLKKLEYLPSDSRRIASWISSHLGRGFTTEVGQSTDIHRAAMECWLDSIAEELSGALAGSKAS